MNESKLKENMILICCKNFTVPVTGMTFSYYKNHKYRITNYLSQWYDTSGHSWHIENITDNNFKHEGWFTEKDILERFINIKQQRKEKLLKINNL